MINPVFRRNNFRIACFRINNYSETKVFKFLLKPVCFVLPLAFLLLVLPEKDLYEEITKWIGSEFAKNVENWQLPALAVVFVLFSISSLVGEIITEFAVPDSELTRDDLLSILYSINTVVSSKNARFLTKTKEALKHRWDEKVIFLNITQPDQQLGLLIKAIHGIFEHLHNNAVNFRIGLMSIEDNMPVAWAFFVPEEHPPKTSPTTLSAPSSTIMRALQAKKMIIIPDVEHELNKSKKDDRSFIKGGSDALSEGSILTLPIYCPNTKKAIYVLSILAKKKNCFDRKKEDLYFWVLDNFLTRILLEHHLMLLKNGGKLNYDC